MPFALIVRAGLDGTGTRRAVPSICSGMNWNLAQAVLICQGPWQDDFVGQASELAQTMAASLEGGLI